MKVEAVDMGAECYGQKAYIIDDILSDDTLRQIDCFRQSLPLDSKRPTVDRRFFVDKFTNQSHHTQHSSCEFFCLSKDHDGDTPVSSARVCWDDRRPLAVLLENCIRQALLGAQQSKEGNSIKSDNNVDSSILCCHVLSWMRFLEYNRAGQRLDPHTDGTKTCEDTGKVSTHTMLLYLCDCCAQQQGGEEVGGGGETILMQNKITPTKSVIPKRGRILLFPHQVWHQGAPVVNGGPKICLRCEVYLHVEDK